MRNEEIMSEDIFEFAKRLWPLHRSLAGEDNRKNLQLIAKLLQNMTIIDYNSGQQVFDWVVPKAWIVKKDYIITPSGENI